MTNIAVILSSTREGRSGEKVAAWVMSKLKDVKGASFNLIDLKEEDIPVFDGVSPKMTNMKYSNENVQKLSGKLNEADGFIIINAEYNHGYTAPLKNLLDTYYPEWNNKPVAFVSYGGISAGTRAMSQLRQVAAELKLISISSSVNIPFVWSAFDENGVLKDENGMFEGMLKQLTDQLLPYAEVLKALRK